MIPFWLLVVLLMAVVPALPVLRHSPGWPSLALASLKGAFLWVIPTLVFLLSVGMVPDWKGGAHGGWLAGFHEGKFALSPLVLLAVVASWYREVWWNPETPLPRWVGWGHLAGALVASVCALVGPFIVDLRSGDSVFLVVPFWSACWFDLRALQWLRERTKGWIDAGIVALLSSPLFAGSLVWSYQVYQQLPDEPPDCFVVTAANRGHPGLVGPFVRVERHGRSRWANPQLQTFWALEEQWATRFPKNHAVFRRIYNRIGPIIARRVTSPLLADLLWLHLKPLEWLARRLVVLAQNQ